MNTSNRFSAKAYLLSAVSSLAIGPAAFAQEGQNLYSNNCPDGRCPQPAATASATQTAGWWTRFKPGSAAANKRVVQTSGGIPSAATKINGTTASSRSQTAIRSTTPTRAPAQQVVAPASAPVVPAAAPASVPAVAPSPGTSEVQRQLDALYRRDGRQMPPMDINSAAAAATAGAAQQASMPKPPPFQPKPSLLDRILGRKPAPTRVQPKLAVPGKKAVPSAIASQPNAGPAITPPVEPQPFQAPPTAAAPEGSPAAVAPQAPLTADAGAPVSTPAEGSADFFPELAESKEMENETPFSGLKLDEESELPIVNSSNAGAAQTAAGDDSREAQYKLLASRAGKPGFKGFCPVTLKTQRKLVDANPAFKSVYELAVYTFASAEAKAEFDAAPASFVPAANGIDVVAYDDDGEKTPGSLEFAVWYQGRLFLFSSQESLDKFVESPGEYADID